MSWRRRSSTVALTVVMATTTATAGWGHHAADHSCTGNAETRGGSGAAGGECESKGSGGEAGGEATECDQSSRDVAYFDDPPEARSDDYLFISLQNPPPEGMTWAAAYNCAGRYLGGPHLIPDPGWVDIEGVRDAATARVTPPLPAPNVSPSEAVVNFPTWLWVEDGYWQPTSATASEGAVTVRVDARPVRVTWDLDEGIRVCEGPGIPWSEQAEAEYERQPEERRGRGDPACTFTFAHSSSVEGDGVYDASVTVSWEFSWWLNGAAQGTFGTIDRSSSFELRVGEIQALITGY